MTARAPSGLDAQAIIAGLAGLSRAEIGRALAELAVSEQEAVLALLQAVPDVVIQGNARKLWRSRSREYMAAGPAECVAGETLIYNPFTGGSTPIAELAAANIAPIVLTNAGPVEAEVPFLKGRAPLYRVRLASGDSFLATRGHLLLTVRGWVFVGDLVCGDEVPLSQPNLPGTTWVLDPSRFPLGAPHWFRTGADSQFGYPTAPPDHDAQPRSAGDSARGAAPAPDDASARSHGGRNWGGRASSRTHTPTHPSSPPPSSSDFPPLRVSTAYEEYCARVYNPLLGGDSFLSFERWWKRSPLPPPSAPPDRDSADIDLPSVDSCDFYTTQFSTVSSIAYERTDDFYDLTVPIGEHYYAQGMWHHNTAKTFSVCQYLHEQCLNYPRLRVVLTRDTYEALRTSAVRTYREKVIRQDSAGRSPFGVTAFGGERPEYFGYPNGSRIYTKGLDNPESVLSEEWDIAAVCQAELVPGDTWQKLVTRTTGRAGNLPRSYRGPRLIGECNPGPPTHWILSRKDAGHLEFVEHTHTDNPALWDEELMGWTEQGAATMAALDSLEGIDRLRLRDGLWVAAEGTVFTIVEANLGRDLYVDKWPVEITIDPSNGSGPYAALVIQQHNDTILVIDEYYQVGGTDEDFAAWLKASRYYGRLVDAISDPAKPDTIKRLSVLLRHPVRAKEGKKDIVAGINAVKSALLPDPVLKRSKLVIDRDACPMLLDEFSKYVWRQAPRNAPEMNVSATPVDAFNHCIDALSYYISTKHLTGSRASLLSEPTTEVQKPFVFGRG